MEAGKPHQAPRSLRPETSASLVRLGRQGEKAVEMLEEAASQIERRSIRSGEITAYCCRETLMALLRLSPQEALPVNKAARQVVQALAVDPDASAGSALAVAIGQLDEALMALNGRNERQLAAVIRERAGIEPIRFQADLFKLASDLIQALNRGLHGNIDVDSAHALYESTLELVERLFAPMSERLGDVERLALATEIGHDDVEVVAGLSADPRVAQYFFQTAGPPWLVALKDHVLMQPTPAGLWPAAEFLARLARDGLAAEVAAWVEARVSEPSCDGTRAASYVMLARDVGPEAKPAVLRAVVRFSQVPAVIEAAALFVGALQPADLVDDVALEIVDRTLAAVEVK